MGGKIMIKYSQRILLVLALLIAGGCTIRLAPFDRVALMVLPEFRDSLNKNNLAETLTTLSGLDREDGDTEYMRALVLLLIADQASDADLKKKNLKQCILHLEKSAKSGNPSALYLKGFLVKREAHLFPNIHLDELWGEYVAAVESQRYESRLIGWRIISRLSL
jgi:hypothetical protein